MNQKTTVGVSIGYQDVKLVKVGQVTDKNRALINYHVIPFPPQMTTESAQFPIFLKRVLAQFCGESRDLEIWSAISSAKVEMRYLRIPKVPRKQIANTVYWTFKRDVSFDEQNDIFDFVLLGDAIEEGIRKTEVMAYTAPRDEVDQLREHFAKSGYPLTGVTIVPFLLQNLLRSRWLETGAKNVCALYIGRDWSRIDIFSSGNLVLSRGVRAGMRSMIEAVRQYLVEETPAEALSSNEENEPEPENLEDAELPQAEEARKIFFSFIHDSQFKDGPPTQQFSDHEILQMVLPALERLVRQVERTLQHYALKFDSTGVDRIYISGPINTQQIMANHIGEQLDLDIAVFDPMGGDSPISGEIAPPKTRAERESFLPAVGLALSDNEQTPNFIFTYRDKERAAKSKRINSSLFAVLLTIMVACGAFYFWQTEQIDQKETTVFALRRELDAFSPRVTQDLISQLLLQVKKRQEAIKGVGSRYKSAAVIYEVSRLTPKHIRLLRLSVETAPPDEGRNRKVLQIEGVIFGEKAAFESLLAEYLVKLKGSPLLTDFSIQKRAIATVEAAEVLRFTAKMEIG
jgi:type IV pilus assembly protein PilM